MIPIRYRESDLGFLVVFIVAGQEALTEDMQTLLRILATQIAPQVYDNAGTGIAEKVGRVDIDAAQGMLRLAIDSVEGGGAGFGVSLLRFVTPRTLATMEEANSYHQACLQMTRRHEPRATLLWLSADTAFALFPESNLAQSEITCMALAENFRETELANHKGNNAAELIFASAAWPQEADSTIDIINLVWARLLAKIQAEASRAAAEKSVNA